MTGRGQRGFALADLLLACLIVCLAGAELFSILAACGRRESRSSRMTAAAGVAEMVGGREATQDRSLANPEGEEVTPGEAQETIHAAHRAFRVTVRKEEVEGCPGLSRKWIIVAMEGTPQRRQEREPVCIVTGSYDPF